MPAQASALDILEARINPHSQAIPRHIGLRRSQIGEHDPWMLITHFPLHQQRATQSALLLGKTLHHALPLRPRRRHPATDPVKGLFPNGTGLDRQINAQEWLPATGHNGRIEPPGIQAAIRQPQHFPVSGHTALQALQQPFPVRTPRALGMRPNHFPGHWNGSERGYQDVQTFACWHPAPKPGVAPGPPIAG